MKIKHTILILVVLWVAGAMIGCKKESPHSAIPSDAPVDQQAVTIPVNADFFMLCCENSDFTIDYSKSYSRDVMYQLVSAFPITSSCDCSITFDKAVPYMVTVSDIYETEIADDISILTYLGKDWRKIASDIKQCTTKAEVDNLLEANGLNCVQQADKNVKLYSTFVMISFGEIAEDVELNNLIITVNGISKQYDIGSILLMRGSSSEINNALYVSSVCLSDVPASIDNNGFISSFEIEADINDEVVLKGISLLNDNAEIKEALIQVTKIDGTTITYLFDPTEPVDLERGDKLIIALSNEYKTDNSRGLSNGQYLVAINFEVNGEEACDYAEIIYRARFSNIFHYYISSELGLDIVSYWIDYLPALSIY